MSNPPTSSGASPFSLFGQTSGAPPSNTLFGGGSTTQQSSGVFGTPSKDNASKPSFLGASGTATTPASKGMFSFPSTTPAGPPPGSSSSSSMFGQPSGGTSMFGAVNSSDKGNQPASTSSFGGLGSFGDNKQTTSPSLFGSPAQGPTSTTPSTQPLFGSIAKPASSSTFGGSQQPQTSPGNIFGKPVVPAASSTNEKSQNAQNSGPIQPSPFGSSNLFGASPKPTSTSSPFSFGGTSSTAPNTQAGTSSLFQTSSPSVNYPSLSTPTTSATAQIPSTTAPATVPSTNLFGGTSATAKPSTTNFLGFAQPKPQEATQVQAIGASAPNLSSDLSKDNASTAAPTTAPGAASTLFKGFSLTKEATNPASSTAETTDPKPSTTLAAPKQTGLTFGGTTPAPTTLSAVSTSTAPAFMTGSSAAPSTNPFGASRANDSNPKQLQIDQKPSETTTGGSANLSASTAGPQPPAQSRLKNKSMDEIITRWASDLTKYQKEFQAQAEKVAKWDRMLVENSNSISQLYSKAFQAERDTAEVQKQLSSIEGQQDELTQWLDHYEKDVDEMIQRQGGQGEVLQGPDQERERTYKIAEKISDRLNDVGNDLTKMIDEINSATAVVSKTSRPDDPLTQIVRILNSHLSQLQSIDQGTAELRTKVADAQKESQRLGARNHNGLGNDAADDFYRSFMSRD